MPICDWFISIWSNVLVPRAVHTCNEGFWGWSCSDLSHDFQTSLNLYEKLWGQFFFFFTKMASSQDGTCPATCCKYKLQGLVPLCVPPLKARLLSVRDTVYYYRGPTKVNSNKRHGPKSSNSTQMKYRQMTATLLKHTDSDFKAKN